MNRRDLVLAVLSCAEGRPYTPVQIQKAMFLIVQQMPDLIQNGPDFDFQPYDFGPFESDVYSEASALKAEGLAVIAPSGIGNWNTYAASDAGVATGKELLNELSEGNRDFLMRVSAWVRAQSFSSLVKSIYDAYPAMKENSIFRG